LPNFLSVLVDKMKFLLLVAACEYTKKTIFARFRRSFVIGLLSGANAQVRWAAARDGRVPAGAFPAGHQSGQQLYLCRGFWNGDLIAGKLDTVMRGCFIPHGGVERRQQNYDGAIGNNFSWVNFSRSWAIPNRAFLVGHTANREATFACRTWHDGHLLPGKVHRNWCYVANASREHRYENYAILVDN
jgi:hypothetical protein